MPKLYEYFGLVVMFYANEHEPVHVHGKFADKESKAVIWIEGNDIIMIEFVAVKGRLSLEKKEMRKFQKLVNAYKYDIVQKWKDYFKLHLEIKAIKILKELK